MMNFKTVETLFIQKYPTGSIWKESTYSMNNVFNVNYTTNGKVYTYSVHNLDALMIKLRLKECTPVIEKKNSKIIII